MPALNGQVVLTLTDGNGAPVFVITESYTVGTLVMRDATVQTSTGPKVGALVVDNMTGRTQAVTATSDTGTVKTFSIPTTGRVLTAAQLAAIPAPNGPVTTMADLAGIAPSIT